jgi:catechol 2,3-dioxygenase-like lactoylglutathione lyase family enzyme
MLQHARLQTLIWSADVPRAKRFYEEVLRLTFTHHSHGAAVFNVGGSELRISPVPSTRASEHTVLGFAVDDLAATAYALVTSGVVTERFAGFAHDPDGVWTAPDGTQVLWFRDPDGNLLSAVQYA